MPLLSFSNISKSFFGVPVLHDIDLTLEPGEVMGLIGENGSGKSTSMNILGGVHRPDAGEMLVDDLPFAPADPREALKRGIAFIHQELNLFSNLSIEENIFIGGFPHRHRFIPLVNRKRIGQETRRLLKLVELDAPPGTPVASLSQGERQLVEIAKALSTDARIIIFDEPTTSLTRLEADRLFAIITRLKAQQIGIIYISHNLTDVLQLSDRIVVLRDGRLIGSGARREFTVERMISMMVGRSITQLFPLRKATVGEPVLEVSELTQPGIIRGVSFSVRRGEVVGLAGLMGAGRSETARILFGLDPFRSGTIHVDGKPLLRPDPHKAMAAGLAFLTEDRRSEGLLMTAPIFDTEALPNLERHAGGPASWIDRPALLALAKEFSRRVQINTQAIDSVPARNLSGGNQQKVVLAKWLMRKPKVFILDEPTRGVDVGAKTEIYKIINDLVEGGCGVLIISSEMEELVGMCDRILVMSNGEISGTFERGDFNQEKILEAAMKHRMKEPA